MTRSTEDSKRRAREALEKAQRDRKVIDEQAPVVRSEVTQLGFLLQENNLARRLRRAMLLKWGGA